MAHKSKFIPKHPEKYVASKHFKPDGKYGSIICRSEWERSFCIFLDSNGNILKWASEEIYVNYFHPFKKKICRYYPDFLVKCKTRSGIKIYLIEIKPYKQTRIISEKMSLASKTIAIINQAKFLAAQKLCQEKNWEFLILTEKNINFVK